ARQRPPHLVERVEDGAVVEHHRVGGAADVRALEEERKDALLGDADVADEPGGQLAEGHLGALALAGGDEGGGVGGGAAGTPVVARERGWEEGTAGLDGLEHTRSRSTLRATPGGPSPAKSAGRHRNGGPAAAAFADPSVRAQRAYGRHACIDTVRAPRP